MATAVKLARLEQEEIKPAIGSRILNGKAELLSGELGPQLRELLEQRGILVFPKIGFTDDEQVAFTKTMGEFAPEMTDGGAEKIHKITLDAKENPTSAEYLKGSLYWHIDGTMNKLPILASLLSCKKPSPRGTGNTGFCNTYAAYEGLPEEKKAAYETLRVRHGAWASLLYYSPEPDVAMLRQMQRIGDANIPLVWKHRSGRKSLVIGCTAHTIVGMDVMDSTLLIHELREWATQEAYSYSHEWSEGDLVIWDNTGTMHRAEPYDVTSGRMMHRTKLMGDEPFE